jgi:hypothetical protein
MLGASVGRYIVAWVGKFSDLYIAFLLYRAIATVLVQRGVLKKGSVVVAGSCSGKVGNR